MSRGASGSLSNKVGTNFASVISGNADSVANHLIAGEQFNKGAGCASTYAGASTRERLELTTTYELTFWTNPTASGEFSVTAHFGAAHRGVHGVGGLSDRSFEGRDVRSIGRLLDQSQLIGPSTSSHHTRTSLGV